VTGVLVAPLELFVSARFLYIPQAVMLDGLGCIQAFRRTGSLASGPGYPAALGLKTLIRVFFAFISPGFIALIVIGVRLMPQSSNLDRSAEAPGMFALLFASLGLTYLLLAPFSSVATTLLYYDRRVRREGIDIETVAAEIGFPIAPDYFGGVTHNPATRKRKRTPHADSWLPPVSATDRADAPRLPGRAQ
jgi:hypothetical protein